MPVYEYKGVATSGRSVSGVMDGESLKAVKSKLKKDGIVVLEVQEGRAVRAARSREFGFGERRVRLIDLANATRLPLMEALTIMVEQEEKAGLKAALSSVRDAVREGSSLADALKANPKVFSQLYVNMVAAGEASGTLEITLERLADFLEEQVRLRGRITSALAYPAFMTVIGMVMLIVILTYVMPKVIWIFKDMKQQLPFPTLVLMGTVNILTSYWWLILLALAAGGYYLQRYFNTPEGKGRLDAWLLDLPVLGSLLRMIAVSRFTRTLGTLLEGGVPALAALDIVQSVIGNTVLAETVRKARESVREGESIAEPLRRSGLFPPVVVQMISVGEKSGELEKTLLKVSDSSDRMVDMRITTFLSLLEPIIILVMALVIAVMIVAILLPIIQMSSGMR
jgi:general secretion pathway protein F